MTPEHLTTLEFDKIRERLAKHTAFSAGRELALALEPAASFGEVVRRQNATDEARRLGELKPGLTLGGARDVRPAAERAAIDAVLQPSDLLEVASTVRAARLWKSTLARLADRLPTLAAIAERIAEHPQLVEEIERSIGEDGDVLDSASPTLARVRADLRLAHARLMARLQELISSPALRPALQDAIITQRAGRYVVPIKAEYRNQVKGVVHDQSASGQTVFVEPLAIVDLTNRWRQLQIEEEQEIERVLRALSRRVGAQAEALKATVAALAELDLHLAAARLAEQQRATRPIVLPFPKRSAEPVLRLIQARHPLLTGEVVPISVELGADFDQLVITGPNTGGKTVALKTVGLLSLMALAGLQVPAQEGSLVRAFEGVYADIGDEQSIEQSLSTFSSHITRIVGMLRQAGPRTLILLDELGAGTDPQEGSALARAILDYLRARGAYVVATTHYPELKTYAHTTPRVQNASVEFDVATLAPTYRLSVGLPGRSNALAIAARLGVPAEVLERARGYLPEQEAQVERLLAEIQAERRAAAEARERASRELADAEKLRRRWEQAWRELEREQAELRRAARAESEELLAQVRREAHQLLQELRTARADRRQAEQLVERIGKLQPVPLAEPAPDTDRPSEAAVLAPGERVLVPTLGRPGTVLSISGSTAELEVGGIRVRLPLASLSGATRAPEPRPERASYTVSVAARETPSQLDLRGRRREEAAQELDEYLNDAYLAGRPRVRIVHGHGTGAVKQAVRDLLASHPLVKSFAPAPQHEGGDGATIVLLAV